MLCKKCLLHLPIENWITWKLDPSQSWAVWYQNSASGGRETRCLRYWKKSCPSLAVSNCRNCRRKLGTPKAYLSPNQNTIQRGNSGNSWGHSIEIWISLDPFHNCGFFFHNRKYLVSATGILEWGPTTYIIISSNCKAKDLIRAKLKWVFSFSEVYTTCAARVGLTKKTQRERERERERERVWKNDSCGD